MFVWTDTFLRRRLDTDAASEADQNQEAMLPAPGGPRGEKYKEQTAPRPGEVTELCSVQAVFECEPGSKLLISGAWGENKV